MHLLLPSTLHCHTDAQALVRFPAHIQQVDMESNGKRVSTDGTTLPYECGVSHLIFAAWKHIIFYNSAEKKVLGK
jgi:hypothetical protein